MSKKTNIAMQAAAAFAAVLITFSPVQAAQPVTSASDIAITPDFAKATIATNEAVILQTGDTNTVSFEQDMSGKGEGNSLQVSQNGAYNEAYAIQVGDSNRGRISQDGSHNFADLIQRGSNNSADVTQSGNGNIAYAVQSGNNNRIVAIQR